MILINYLCENMQPVLNGRLNKILQTDISISGIDNIIEKMMQERADLDHKYLGTCFDRQVRIDLWNQDKLR